MSAETTAKITTYSANYHARKALDAYAATISKELLTYEGNEENKIQIDHNMMILANLYIARSSLDIIPFDMIGI